VRSVAAPASTRADRHRSSRFSTSTLRDGRDRPWLAASGPLSYAPEAPPDRDYFFQYDWVLPDIFASGVNTLQHYHLLDRDGIVL